MEARLRPTRKKLLGEILVEEKVITRDLLEEAMKRKGNSAKLIGTYLIDMGYVTPRDVAMALARQHGLAYVDLPEFEIDEDLESIIPEEVARKSNIVPISRNGATVTVAISDPSNIVLLDYLKLKKKLDFVPVMSSEVDIQHAHDNLYSYNSNNSSTSLNEMMRNIDDDTALEVVASRDHEEEDLGTAEAEAAPVIRLTNLIISEAIRLRASDIHLEPKEKRLELRYRVDGVLIPMPGPPKKLQNSIITRFKIMAECDIAERRKPQDGRFKVKLEGKAVDFRASFLPCVHGEKVVLRLLDQKSASLDLGSIGFEPDQLKAFKRGIARPNGIVLVTGPTGSGKSTTLYAALSHLAVPEKNVITVEDPVEYQIDPINQVQARPDIGFGFAEALRSILRQDPDIVMIGEMRDTETASIAVKAAITGHLVLSTLHTNDAAGAITRLVDMGVERYMVTASVVLVVAQRLVRRICVNCREAYEPEPEVLEELELSEEACEKMVFALNNPPETLSVEEDARTPTAPGETMVFYRGKGCSSCNRTGYRGRLAIHEVLELTDPVRHFIMEGKHSAEIRIFARKEGMRTLRDSGMAKVMQGLTTVEEVLSTTVG